MPVAKLPPVIGKALNADEGSTPNELSARYDTCILFASAIFIYSLS